MTTKDRFAYLSVTDEPMDLFIISQESHLLEFINDIERYVRNSREYRNYVVWLKLRHKNTICESLGINSDELEGVRIEQHHHPITLFDVTYIIGMKLIDGLKKDEYLTMYEIANEVIREHLVHKTIGTVALTTTYHELYHAGEYNITKKDMIFGNYESFIKKYNEYIPQATMERIQKRIKYLE